MPGDHEVEFDTSTSSSDPYYLEDAIVQLDGALYRVGRKRTIANTRHRALLQFLDTPSDDERSEACEWRWDGDAERMRWMPIA